MKHIIRVAIASSVLVCASFAQTSFKYVAINFPGAFSTQANGINNGGEIVGTYTTSACTASCVSHGFKFVNNKFISINIPGASSTTAEGVNDFGDIVGTFIGSNPTITHGFLLHHTGRLETLDLTGANQSNTTPLGINKNLTVVVPILTILPMASALSGKMASSHVSISAAEPYNNPSMTFPILA